MLFRSWVIDKNGICECVEASSFLYGQITQIIDIDEYEKCAKFKQKDIKLYRSWSSLKFSYKIPGFSNIIKLCLNFSIN